MGDIEEVQLDVERILRKFTNDELIRVAEKIKAKEDDYKDKDKKATLRAIQSVFDDITETDQKMSTFEDVKNVATDTYQDMLEAALVKIAITKSMQEHVTNNTTQPQNTTQHNDTPKILSPNGNEQGITDSLALLRNLNFINRPKLKISGSIGDSKQTNYINLCSQVNEAKVLKHSDEEISAAIKRAVVSSTEEGADLQTIFDSQPDLQLDDILGYELISMRKQRPNYTRN